MTAAFATMDGPPPAAHTAGAPADGTMDWHSIDWDQAHRIVRRLQARIVQATQAGRWGKVRALQRLLTHSFSGKALAVRRVTENQGKRTPGVDRVTWETPAKKMAAVQGLRQRGYRPQPLRRVYIAKSNARSHGRRRRARGRRGPARGKRTRPSRRPARRSARIPGGASVRPRPGRCGRWTIRPRASAPRTRSRAGRGSPGGSLGRVAAIRAWIGQRADDTQELHDRAGPAMGEDQRQRVGLGRAHVQEMHRL